MASKWKIYKILGFLIPPMVLLAGCSIGEPSNPFTGAGGWVPTPPQPEECSSALGVLNWTAGISILGGIIGMVLTNGRMGLRAIVGGLAMVIMSYVIAAYAHLVILPAGICLSVISAIWGYRTILQAWRTRK